jgi:hypothetical protein
MICQKQPRTTVAAPLSGNGRELFFFFRVFSPIFSIGFSAVQPRSFRRKTIKFSAQPGFASTPDFLRQECFLNSRCFVVQAGGALPPRFFFAVIVASKRILVLSERIALEIREALIYTYFEI